MLTNDLKKGARIRLANGWEATIKDNRRGNTRMATVDGLYTETGSVYSHDIVAVETDNGWIPVKHTPKQEKSRSMAERLFR